MYTFKKLKHWYRYHICVDSILDTNKNLDNKVLLQYHHILMNKYMKH